MEEAFPDRRREDVALSVRSDTGTGYHLENPPSHVAESKLVKAEFGCFK